MAVFQLLLTELVSEAALPTALDLLQVLASYGISGDISIVSLNEYERQVFNHPWALRVPELMSMSAGMCSDVT